MSTYPVCDATLRSVLGGPNAPFDCFESDGVTKHLWRFVEVPAAAGSPIPVSGVGSSTANIAYCLGVITDAETTGGDSVIGGVSCSTGWVQAPYTTPFDPSQLDATVLSAMFAGGFLLYLTPWAAGWGFAQLLKLLR